MRILGIDWGTTSIKAVELDSAFGRYEVHEYHEKAIEPGADPAEAVRTLVQGLPRKPDKIVVALQSGQVTFRNLVLPTRDKKAIQAGVGFELEDELPFDMEQAVFEYQVLRQDKQGTHLHVAATLKKHLAALIASWGVTEVEPDVITSEAWAYRGFMNRVLAASSGEGPMAGGHSDQPIMIVQIGHTRTVIYVQHRGVPILAREVSWGGRELSLAICQRYNVPLDQADAAKLDHGFVIPSHQREQATAEQVEFSETLLQPAQVLIASLRQAALTCKNIAEEPVGLVYLSGGTSLLPGLAKVLEENLQLPVRGLQALSSIATSGVTSSERTDAIFLLAASLALGVVDRGASLNFRKGEFSIQGEGKELDWAQLRRPIMALGAMTACLFLSLTVQKFVYQSRLKAVDAQLEKSVRGFFGSVSPTALKTYMASPGTLKSSVNHEFGKQKELNKLSGPNPHSPLDFLQELSTTISKDVVVDMVKFQVGAAPTASYLAPADKQDGTTNLTFVLANQALADKLNALLTPKIASLQKGKLEETPTTDGLKRWKVTFSGKPPESDNAK